MNKHTFKTAYAKMERVIGEMGAFILMFFTLLVCVIGYFIVLIIIGELLNGWMVILVVFLTPTIPLFLILTAKEEEKE